MRERIITTCIFCNGTGTVRAAFMPLEFTCDVCLGSGEYLINKAWIEAGAALKADRISRHKTLREDSHSREVPLALLSGAERGIIDPEDLDIFKPHINVLKD